MRKRPDPYQWVIDEYPPEISKDQLYKICHISKRTASYLLESGLIPNKCTGKKTRKYKIAIADVVEYLKRRDLTPNDYTAPAGWYGCKTKKKSVKKPFRFSEKMQAQLIEFAEVHLEDYEDVLSVAEVSEITGCSSTAVTKWCNRKYLHHYFIKRKFYIPKLSLLEFLRSEHFQGMQEKSNIHLAYLQAKSNS